MFVTEPHSEYSVSGFINILCHPYLLTTFSFNLFNLYFPLHVKRYCSNLLHYADLHVLHLLLSQRDEKDNIVCSHPIADNPDALFLSYLENKEINSGVRSIVILSLWRCYSNSAGKMFLFCSQLGGLIKARTITHLFILCSIHC